VSELAVGRATVISGSLITCLPATVGGPLAALPAAAITAAAAGVSTFCPGESTFRAAELSPVAHESAVPGVLTPQAGESSLAVGESAARV
jgi:hypothetical protein